MANVDYINFDCFEIEQPIGSFYIGKISWRDLLHICYSDIRRIEREEKDEIETYFGIQRELSKKRVAEIADYVKNIDATFPSSVIISIESRHYLNEEKSASEENVFFDKNTKIMKIRRDENIAKIIDGQHRVYGLQKGFESLSEIPQFEFIITVFVDMDLDNQSMVFATINKAQTKVNKSLVYDLFEFAKTKSPQRTAHNIVKLLNSVPSSPFKDKVKILGKADDNKETITQATLVESLLEYISDNPMKDRDVIKRGGKLSLLKFENPSDLRVLKKRIFRNLFILEQEEKIAKILWNYFSAVQERWPLAWESNQLILNKSTGIIAFMKFLKPVYLSFNVPIGEIISMSDFLAIFKKVDIADQEFNTSNYLPGGSGQSKLFHQLIDAAGLEV